jgi:hypothetical protein
MTRNQFTILHECGDGFQPLSFFVRAQQITGRYMPKSIVEGKFLTVRGFAGSRTSQNTDDRDWWWNGQTILLQLLQEAVVDFLGVLTDGYPFEQMFVIHNVK